MLSVGGLLLDSCSNVEIIQQVASQKLQTMHENKLKIASMGILFNAT